MNQIPQSYAILITEILDVTYYITKKSHLYLGWDVDFFECHAFAVGLAPL